MPRGNPDKLKPVRTKQEASERGKKGGIASGEARRARKTLKEELLALLSDADTQEKICISLAKQAQRGNVKAFEVIRDTVGERPVESVSIEVSKNTAEVISEIEKFVEEDR